MNLFVFANEGKQRVIQSTILNTCPMFSIKGLRIYTNEALVL